MKAKARKIRVAKTKREEKKRRCGKEARSKREKTEGK